MLGPMMAMKSTAMTMATPTMPTVLRLRELNA